MKKIYMIFVFLYFICMPVITAEQLDALKRDSKIGDHIQELEKYGKCEEVPDTEPSPSADVLVQSLDKAGDKCKLKIGDGFLYLRISYGVGFVKDIKYVIDDENEKHKTTLNVKEVDLIKGEMTIFLHNNDQKDVPIKAEKTNILKRQVYIGDHMQKLKKYGGCKPVFPEIKSTKGDSEECMLKAGVGYLIVEHSMNAGIVENITYAIVNDENRKQNTKLKVKEVDLDKGKMTIFLNNDEKKAPLLAR
jgi:hypothetical protein